MGMPAARIGDLTVCPGTTLVPGLPSPNVMIGGKFAWLGMTAAAAAALAKVVAEEVKKVAEATAAVTAAPDPTTKSAAAANLVDAQKEMATNVCKAMTGGGTLSINLCAVPLPVPHVQGVVIKPSQTVLINNWGACRVGDPIQEIAFLNSIAVGEFRVLIGG
jgi:uncharacterized Zn-binding protein involved in type VI secretion